jgi:hypothetical protein
VRASFAFRVIVSGARGLNRSRVRTAEAEGWQTSQKGFGPGRGRPGWSDRTSDNVYYV